MLGRISGLFFDLFQGLYLNPALLFQAVHLQQFKMEGAGGSSIDAPGAGAARAPARHARPAGVSFTVRRQGTSAGAFWGEVTPAIEVGCLVKSLPGDGTEQGLLHGITTNYW